MLGLVLSGGKAHASLCTYETWDWDSIHKKSVNHKKISKPVTELTEEERGQIAGCSVCEEDQEEVRLHSLPPFKVCKKFRDRIVRAVNQAVSVRFPVHTIVGYRVGKSKGPLNSLGQRTQFSNHSFGTAIDINSELNGLYDFCFRFGPQCKLIRGGEYRKEVFGAISKSSSLYKAMIAEGFKWGGEIDGKQKDFMHFSLSGM
jgi:hypothetical protein